MSKVDKASSLLEGFNFEMEKYRWSLYMDDVVMKRYMRLIMVEIEALKVENRTLKVELERKIEEMKTFSS